MLYIGFLVQILSHYVYFFYRNVLVFQVESYLLSIVLLGAKTNK